MDYCLEIITGLFRSTQLSTRPLSDNSLLPSVCAAAAAHEAHPVLSMPQLLARDNRKVMDRAPVEVWDMVFSYLYPSQLARVSLVSKHLHDMVASSNLWANMFKKALPGESLALIPELLPGSLSYMLFMCAMSFQVCELCFLVCNGSRGGGGLPAMPLKVHLDWAGDEIKLCLECRQNHFEAFPEPISASFQCDQQMPQQWRRTWSSLQIDLEDSRKSYGGDVGILACPCSLSRPLKYSRGRVYFYYKRRQVVLDGGTWHNIGSPSLTRA